MLLKKEIIFGGLFFRVDRPAYYLFIIATMRFTDGAFAFAVSGWVIFLAAIILCR